jgi:2-polyprenyl-3-methyl-5-hydroxy-6-metoxy-1,4-benzoquinol methylase
MVANVLERERSLYEDMWQVSSYAANSPGERRIPMFLEMANIATPHEHSVLDAGSGSGRCALALQGLGFKVRMCDLVSDGLIEEARGIPFSTACLWDDLKPALGFQLYGRMDYAYCADVMEHIPTPFTMLVAYQLLKVVRYGVFFTISLRLDWFGPHVGKQLHQSIQTFTEWRDQLNTVGEVVEARDLLMEGVYFVRPRR